jgi:hypothetical protein
MIEKLLTVLKRLKKSIDSDSIDIEFNRGIGICQNISAHFADESYKPILKDLFKTWPKFSGELCFPVEGSFRKYYSQIDKWSKTTKYGRLRRQLLNYLIRELSSAKTLADNQKMLHKELLDDLKRIKKFGPEFKFCGICNNVRVKNSELILGSLFKSWKHYSGSLDYPVEGSARKYGRYQKWSATTKYGRLRWQLLNHCIRELEYKNALY